MSRTSLILAASSIFALAFAAPLRLNNVTPSTLMARASYVMYGGDGSPADGWPTRSSWMPFEQAWAANLPTIQQSCANNGWGANNDATETAAIKDSIEQESTTSGIPKEFILAIMMQESKGCVRVPTTSYGFANPGLMQSAGQASCNPNGTLISPCPAPEIRAMIHDGTAGEGLRTTLKSSLASFDPSGTSTDDSKWYKAARRYNAGDVLMNEKNLGIGPTQCYASDIANRLVQPFGDSTCNSSFIATLSSAQEGTGTGTTTTTSTATNTDTTPKASQTPTANTTASNSCSKYYTPKQTETCASFPIDFATLRKLNALLDDTCSNLQAGQAYCVAA